MVKFIVSSKKLSNLPRVTDLVISRAGIQILDIIIPTPQYLRAAGSSEGRRKEV